jgi:hypothetical protein
MLKSTTLLGALLLLCAQPLPAQRADIGMNLGMPWYDYDPLKIFADAVKEGRGFEGPTQGSTVAKDADGWPLGDCNILVWQDPRRMNGTYRLWFTTQNAAANAGAVTVTGATLTNRQYDAAANMVRADITVADTGQSLLRLYFTNTAGGVKNVKMLRPLVPGSATPYDTTVTFTTSALNLCRKFSVLRFMQVVNTLSSNMIANWADRTKKSYCCQQARTFGGTGSAGVAWEYVVQLCNEAGTDLYANIPFLATDAYVDSLAALIKKNLDPSRNIYTEYSNELWNYSADYDEQRNHDSAVAEVNRGNSPLDFDSTASGANTWAWRRAGKRGLEISRIFRSAFGDSAMMTRVRPLLMTQLDNGQATFSDNMKMLLDYYNNSAHVATPRPPNYYFYGAGGAPYYTPSGTYTASTIWTSGDMNLDSFAVHGLKADIAWCATFGLKRVAYEGGPGFDAQNAAEVAAWHDNRMTRSIIDHHDSWSNYGGDLFVYFTLTGWGYTDLRFSFLTDPDAAATPKMAAIDSLRARPVAPVTYGSLAPCAIDGDSAAVRFTPLWDPPSSCRPTEWYSYVVRIEQAGTYAVTVDYTAPAAGALALLGDGTQIGTPTLASGTHTTAKSTLFLEPGLHGIIVRITSLASGRMSINQVNVSVESLVAGASVARRTASAARPTLRCVGGRLVVNAVAGPYVVSTLTGRIVAGGNAQAAGAVPASLGSGIYLLRTPGGSAAVALTR